MITRQRVDLPAPLRPMTASTEPLGTLNDTSRRAGISRPPESRAAEQAANVGDQVRGVDPHAVRRRHLSTSIEGSSRPEGCSRATTVSPIACPPLCCSLSQAVALTQPPIQTPRTDTDKLGTIPPAGPIGGKVSDTLRRCAVRPHAARRTSDAGACQEHGIELAGGMGPRVCHVLGMARGPIARAGYATRRWQPRSCTDLAHRRAPSRAPAALETALRYQHATSDRDRAIADALDRLADDQDDDEGQDGSL